MKKRYYATNTDNICMILSQGLITGPEGYFGGNYCQDILHRNPKYIRLDTIKTIPEAIGEAKSKNDSLVVCLLEIADPTIAPEDKEDSESETPIFCLSPMPLSCVSNVIFKSKADLDDFKNNSKLFSNISIAVPLKVATSSEKKVLNAENNYLFSATEEIRSESSINSDDYTKVYAYGGVLANLFYFSINNKNIHKELTRFAELEFDDDGFQGIKALYNYFFESTSKYDSALISKEEEMFKKLLDLLSINQRFKDEIVAYLESSSIAEGKAKQRAQEIASNLKDYSEGNVTKSNKDFIIEAKSGLEKYLLLLFMRERTDVLLPYLEDLTKQNQSTKKIVKLDDSEKFLLAALFGVRDKFVDIPTSLRRVEGLEKYISTKMANYAHYLQKSERKYRNAKSPLTFREMLSFKNATFSKWLSGQAAQKIDIAKFAAECLFTEMPAKKFTNDKGKSLYFGYIEPTYLFDEEMLDTKCADVTVSIDDYKNIQKAYSASLK